MNAKSTRSHFLLQFFCFSRRMSINGRTLCGSKKYPYPPHGRDFPYDPPPPPPHPSGNSNLASYIALNFWLFQTPPPPRNSQSLLWGEYGYLLEPHIVKCGYFAYRSVEGFRWLQASLNSFPFLFKMKQEELLLLVAG